MTPPDAAVDRAEALVSTAWLDAHLGDPSLRIVDASYHLPSVGRDARAEYEACHIPGAVFFDLDWVADPDHELHHMLPDAEVFAARVGALGLGDDCRIVAYDSRGLYSAARAWWMFRLYHHDRVAILDGGLPKWLNEGRAAESGAVVPQPAHFTPAKARDLACRWQQVRANIDSHAAALVDARTPAYFTGAEPSPYPGTRNGHIPGSVNLWYNALLDGERKTVRPTAEIRAAFARAGVALDKPVIATCGSGVTACILALGLHLCGHDAWTVYDGSWAEWGRRSDLPVAR